MDIRIPLYNYLHLVKRWVRDLNSQYIAAQRISSPLEYHYRNSAKPHYQDLYIICGININNYLTSAHRQLTHNSYRIYRVQN